MMSMGRLISALALSLKTGKSDEAKRISVRTKPEVVDRRRDLVAARPSGRLKAFSHFAGEGKVLTPFNRGKAKSRIQLKG
jgi:hypothetical protein